VGVRVGVRVGVGVGVGVGVCVGCVCGLCVHTYVRKLSVRMCVPAYLCLVCKVASVV
jgi:hypothetical protein